MRYRLLHAGVHFGEFFSDHKMAALEQEINLVSADWIKYSSSNWLLWTNSYMPTINAAFKRGLTLNDQFIIFEIGPGEMEGLHYQSVWEWLAKYRISKPPALPPIPPNNLRGIPKPPDY